MNLITTQIQGVLENEIFNQINALNLKIPNTTVRAIVSRVAETSAISIIKIVGSQTNFNLSDIPKNLIGVNNPVNVVNGNLGSTGVTKNLDNIIQNQVSAQITNSVVSALEAELKRSLPVDKRNLINFGNVAAILVQKMTPAIGGVISTALSGTINSIFSGNLSIKQVIPGVTNLFSSLGSAAALDKITSAYSSSIANKYLTQAKNFNVNSTDNNEKLTVLNQGFTDPNANYPTKEYAGISETNKLAQGDVRGTVVQEKNNSRMQGAKLPGGDAWSQPESPFKGEYPYNKVTQTESGHIIEMDDTPGAERLHIYHKSGTFVEIDANGSIVKRAVGSSYEIIDKNGKIAIAGKADISVNGACNIFVGNDANIEVEGDVNLKCHNDITAQAGGTMNLSAKEEVNITSEIINLQAYNKFNISSNAQLNLHSTHNTSLLSNANIFVQAVEIYETFTTSRSQGTNSHINLSETQFTQTGQDINLKAGGKVNAQSEGAMNLLASGTLSADGSQIHINSGNATGAEAAETSQPATLAGISNIGILEGRKDIEETVVNDPVALTLADVYALKLEEDGASTSEYKSHRDLILTSGFASASKFDTTPSKLKSSSETSTQSTAIAPDSSLKTRTELPGNYNLSPNFTVENLSTKASLTKERITATDKVKYGDIVYNLQAVALNILEPAYNVYPSLTIASGYRSPTQSSSRHNYGECVDVQFQGATKEEYYDIAVQLSKILNYDQLILEYCNYSNNPWIHISYSTTNNRKQTMTFWNNKKYADGIAKLD